MNDDVAGLVERLGVYADYVEYDPPLNYEDAAATTMREAASTIRALDAKLREAVEVMQSALAVSTTTTGPGYEAITRFLRDFLTDMEKQPSPAPRSTGGQHQ